LITASKPHAVDNPVEGEKPVLVLMLVLVLVLPKGAGGMVVEKVPTWSVSGSVTGLIRGAVLLKMKKLKVIFFRGAIQAELELGVEGEEGDAHRRRHNAHAKGAIPHLDRRHHHVGGRGDHRDCAGDNAIHRHVSRPE
jgi:hypothetical protein